MALGDRSWSLIFLYGQMVVNRLFPLLLVVLLLGCDASGLDAPEPELFSGRWESPESRVSSALGQLTLQYVLDLDVSSDGTFSGVLTQRAEGEVTRGSQDWKGRIEGHTIRALAFGPPRLGNGLGSSQSYEGTISERSITFEGSAFSGYPGGELRFFPAR